MSREETLNILGKHSLDLPVEHPTHGLGQILTRGLGLARACYRKCKMLPSLVVLQGPRAVPLPGEGIISGWVLTPALHLLCAEAQSLHSRFKNIFQEIKDYEICVCPWFPSASAPLHCLSLSSFSLQDGKILISQNPRMGWGRGWKGTLKITVFNLVPSLFSVVTTSGMPLCTTCRAPPAVLTFPFLDKRA